MFLIPVVLVDFCRKFEHVFVSLRHICTHKEESRLVGYIESLRHICTHKEESRLVGYIACEGVEGGDS